VAHPTPINPDEVDGCGGNDMLQVGLGLTDVAGTPHAEGTDAQGDRSFNPRSFGILLLEVIGPFSPSRCPQGMVLLLRAHCNRATAISDR
jgi:hypothetical protein